MPPVVAVAAAAGAGIAALALTPYMRRLAGNPSVWLESGLHAVVAVLIAGGGALVATSWAETATLTVIAVLSGLLVTIDLAVHRLPNWLMLLAALTTGLGLVAAAMETGHWYALLRALLAGVLIGGSFVLLALVNPAGLGFGDVKLAAVMSVLAGWFGWTAILIALLAAFVTGGIFALGLVIVGRKDLRSSLAFGPWLVLGGVIGIGLA